MDAVFAFLENVLLTVRVDTLIGLQRHLVELALSLDLYFWLLIALPLLRFQLPALAVWLIHTIRPNFWNRTSRVPGSRGQPKVSVLIAGRNEEDTIGATIRSVLGCGYVNLEVIFVNDASTDKTLVEAKKYERTGRVRVYNSTSQNGKPSSLNIAMAVAKGDYLLIIDADSEIQFGAIDAFLDRMRDPSVGAIAGNLRVRNAPTNLLTRLQECEYALNVTITRMWRAELGLLSIVPGAAGFFRTKALRDLGGFDTGLGDDTDVTLRLRKAGWKLGFAPNAVIWTNVPITLRTLVKQRQRWERNMVKIRLRKQNGLFSYKTFGIQNLIMMVDLVAVRVVLPTMFVLAMIVYFTIAPFSAPILITHLFWVTMAFSLFKLLAARDVVNTPRLTSLVAVPIIPLYRIFLRLVVLQALVLETLRIGMHHPYVPPKIWDEIEHW